MFKKTFGFLFLFSILLSALYFYFIFPYTITLDKKDIDAAVTKWINKSEASGKYVELLKTENIKSSDTYISTYMVSNDKYFRTKDYIGFSVLKKGLNGKYKISSSKYTTNHVVSETIKTSNGKYVLLFGKNLNETPGNVIVAFQDEKENFERNISGDEYFFVYKKVSKEFNENQSPTIKITKK